MLVATPPVVDDDDADKVPKSPYPQSYSVSRQGSRSDLRVTSPAVEHETPSAAAEGVQTSVTEQAAVTAQDEVEQTQARYSRFNCFLSLQRQNQFLYEFLGDLGLTLILKAASSL